MCLCVHHIIFFKNFPLFSVPSDFRIVFEAIMRDQSIIEEDNRGDIAIDDVIIETNVGCGKQCDLMFRSKKVLHLNIFLISMNYWALSS